MNNIKYIGIDVHQATSVFCVADSRGKFLSEAILETKPATIIDYLKGQRGTLWVTFEEGTYANWLHEVIDPHVAKLIVCDPRKNKLDGNKSDKIDARRLAELLRLNALKAVYHGKDNTKTLKELAHSYVSLQQDSTRIEVIVIGRNGYCSSWSFCRSSVLKPKKIWFVRVESIKATKF